MTSPALRTRTLRLSAPLALALASGASAQNCEPTFSDLFAAPDLNGAINAVAVYNDGNGPALYIGGNFSVASGATCNRIAKWDGKKWASLGTGMNGVVNALMVHDEDGPGPIPPALYIGGSFTSANGVAASRLAKWNGAQFSAAGNTDNTVSALLSATLNGVPTLVAGGAFANIAGVPASRIAAYSAGSWSALGSGVNNTVNALALYTDQNGPAVYAAGLFTGAGAITANRIARWDGAQWSALGDGLGAEVKTLHVHTDITGTNVYAGGLFTTAGAISANRIARWNGTQWTELSAGLNSTCNALYSYEGLLYASGAFTTAGGLTANRIATFDGVNWAAVDTGVSGTGFAMTSFDLGKGQELILAGNFSTAGDATTPSLARWNTQYWTDIGRGASGTIRSFAMYDGELIVGGDYNRIAGEKAEHVAAFDGQSFAPVGDGFNFAPLAIVSFDPDGAGPAEPMLVAGGNFSQSGAGATIARFARWSGTQWVQIGSGASGQINSMVVFDDGSGPAVYLGGNFTTVNGVSASRIARWNGTTVTQVGAGLGSTVNDLVVHNGALYAVGAFTTSGTTTLNRVARWDGAAWQPLGVGANGIVSAAASYNGQLYVGGAFTSIGGISANRMGRWDGAAWADVAGGATANVKALEVFNDGRGQALFVGGDFLSVGAPVVTANRLARFDGAWTAVSTGADNAVETLYATELSGTPTLMIGGSFRTIGGLSSDRIAALEACTASCYANCDGSTTAPILNVNDFICFQQKYAAADPSANCDGSTTTPTLNVNDFICFQQKYAAGCP